MGKRHVVAWVKVAVFEDDDGPPHTVEVSEWRRSSNVHLSAFLDFYGDDLDAEERCNVEAAVQASTHWLLTDALALDSGSMF